MSEPQSAATPTPTPTPTQEQITSEGPDNNSNEFDFTITDEDTAPVVEVNPESAENPTSLNPEGTVLPEVQKQPEVQPETTAQPPAEPTKDAATPEQSQPTTPTPEPVPQGLSPEQVKEQREAALKDLTASYNISDEDAESFQLDPKSAVPRALAHVHLRAVETALQLAAQMMQSAIPMGVQQYMQAQRVNEEVNSRITERWPGLKDHLQPTSPKYKEVFNIFAWYKQQYPQMTEQELIEEAGSIAAKRLGVGQVQPQQPIPTPQPARNLPPFGGVRPTTATPGPDTTGNEFDFRDVDFTT